MPYPQRPQLRPLPAFAGTARTGTVPSARLQAQLDGPPEHGRRVVAMVRGPA